MDHGDLEAGVVLPRLFEYLQGEQGLEPTDHQQGVKRVSLEAGGDTTEVDVGQGTVRPELGTSSRGPVVDSQPGQFLDGVVEQTVETVLDTDGGVTTSEAVSHGLTGGGVHSTGRGTDAAQNHEVFSVGCERDVSVSTHWMIPIRSRYGDKRSQSQTRVSPLDTLTQVPTFSAGIVRLSSKVELALKACNDSANSGSRYDIALSKSLSSMAVATAWVCATASKRGFLVILFSLIPIMYEGVSGVAESKASTASTPCKVACSESVQLVADRPVAVGKGTHEDSIVSARRSTSLSVSEGGDPSVQTEPVDEDVLDVITLDRVEVLVQSTFGDDDDRLSLADLAVLLSEKRS